MKLGKNQQRVLDDLRERGYWTPDEGLIIYSPSETKRMLDGLGGKGLVALDEDGRYVPREPEPEPAKVDGLRISGESKINRYKFVEDRGSYVVLLGTVGEYQNKYRTPAKEKVV